MNKLDQISLNKIHSVSHRKPQTASPLSGRLLAGPFHELWLVLAEGAAGSRGLYRGLWRSQSCPTARGKQEHGAISHEIHS